MNYTNSLFDPSLTLQNAKEKGFRYIDDVIYDFLNPNDSIKDILEFSREFHCKLGTPASAHLDTFFGLYMPINQIYEKHHKIK